jgi:hypothetical protein
MQQFRALPGNDDRAVTLIIDQFEEILTTNPEYWPERDSFFRQLGRVIEADEMLWVVLAMREDYLAGLDPYAHHLPDKMRARFHMQRLGFDAAMEAVIRPAANLDVDFPPNVASDLVDNLRRVQRSRRDTGDEREAGDEWLGAHVEPVYLQIVCHQLWNNLPEREPGTVITSDHVQDFGDPEQVLTEFYEDRIVETVEATAVSQRRLRHWFDGELITPGRTRDQVYKGTEENSHYATG